MCKARIVPSLLLAALVLASSCSKDPEKQKLEHLQRGDQYVAEKRDEFAVVEYASAVKIDPKFGEARFKLAEAYERLNNLREAYPQYIRAADALPEDRKAQLKATQVLLRSGLFEDAKARIAALIAKNPNDVEALLLHANAMVGLRDPAGAIAEVEEALKISPEDTRALMTLGAVQMRTGEAKEAEASYRKAVAMAPDSVDARLGLASFLWAAGRVQEAEANIKEALGKEPQHLLANRMLATLYLATRRTTDAEAPLKAVAGIAKTPAARFQLADYYVSQGRTADATTVLSPLAADQATSAEAEIRLAALDYTAGRAADAYKRLDAVLPRVPNPSPALVIKAQWLAKENKLDEALGAAKSAVAADPQSAAAHFALGSVLDRRRETAAAAKSYTEVLRLNPRAAGAQVALSRLNLAAGETGAALRYAEEARATDPKSPAARVALVRSLLATGNLARAESEINLLLKGAPGAAEVHTLNGLLMVRKKDAAAARRSFERALELSPGYLDALGGLTYLDLTGKSAAQAIARLESELAKRPNEAPLLALASSAYISAGNLAKAEQLLRKAVSDNPNFISGYGKLAQLYMQQGRLDEARVEYEGMVKRDPSSSSARTMVGVLFEAQGRREEARKSYEATVSATDKAPLAANNLAFIYAEQGTNLDIALQLATSAKQQLPNDPEVDDTIGWIYYKKNQPSLAVRPLEASVTKLPGSAEVLYHLGLTYAKIGDKEKARDTLQRALKLDPNVGGGEARRVLETVSR